MKRWWWVIALAFAVWLFRRGGRASAAPAAPGTPGTPGTPGGPLWMSPTADRASIHFRWSEILGTDSAWLSDGTLSPLGQAGLAVARFAESVRSEFGAPIVVRLVGVGPVVDGGPSVVRVRVRAASDADKAALDLATALRVAWNRSPLSAGKVPLEVDISGGDIAATLGTSAALAASYGPDADEALHTT